MVGSFVIKCLCMEKMNWCYYFITCNRKQSFRKVGVVLKRTFFFGFFGFFFYFFFWFFFLKSFWFQVFSSSSFFSILSFLLRLQSSFPFLFVLCLLFLCRLHLFLSALFLFALFLSGSWLQSLLPLLYCCLLRPSSSRLSGPAQYHRYLLSSSRADGRQCGGVGLLQEDSFPEGLRVGRGDSLSCIGCACIPRYMRSNRGHSCIVDSGSHDVAHLRDTTDSDI